MCRFRNVSFEITSTDIGVFEVTGRFLGRQIEKVELVFQVSEVVLGQFGLGSSLNTSHRYLVDHLSGSPNSSWSPDFHCLIQLALLGQFCRKHRI